MQQPNSSDCCIVLRLFLFGMPFVVCINNGVAIAVTECLLYRNDVLEHRRWGMVVLPILLENGCTKMDMLVMNYPST